MRYLIVLCSLCLVCTFASANPPQAPRPPQAPPVRGVCDCAGKQDCLCNGVRCDCPNCQCRDCPGFTQTGHRPPQAPPCCETQEDRWRAEGWQQDAAGQWYRVVGPASPLVTPAGYSAPVPLAPAFYPAPAFFGGGLGGCVGGG